MDLRSTKIGPSHSSLPNSRFAHICRMCIDVGLGAMCFFGLSLIIYGLFLFLSQNTSANQFFDLVLALTTFVMIVSVASAIWLIALVTKAFAKRFMKPAA